MANKCPNKNHPDWLYSVEKLGEDRTLFIYDRLGQEIPTKEQVDSILPPIAKKTEHQSPASVIEEISMASTKEDVEKIIMGYKGVIGSKRHEGRIWLKAMYEFTLDNKSIAEELIRQVNSVYPGLLDLKHKQTASFRANRGVYEVVVSEYAWNKYLNRNNPEAPIQGTLFKRDIVQEKKDLQKEQTKILNEFFKKSENITNAYDYIDAMEEHFTTMSQEHRDLIKMLKDVRSLNPDIKIKQINRAQVERNLEGTDDLEGFMEALAWIYDNNISYKE